MADPATLLTQRIARLDAYAPAGRLCSALDALIEVQLPRAVIGEVCDVHDPVSGQRMQADVIGFRDGTAMLAPSKGLDGLSPQTEVRPTGRPRSVPVGPGLLGRVVDPTGTPIDGRGPVQGEVIERALHAAPPPAMRRAPIADPFPVGVRAIDGVLTCGRGQRVGLFGEPGGGKSTLLAALVRGAAAGVCVIALVGERGREVREFIEDTLGPEGLARSIVVVATSDRPAVERASAALAATAIAEFFRDTGEDVLLVVDSITRYARACRDLALAAGALPARRGFPPSALAGLPGLLERAGCAETGSITAFYTVLVEGDGSGDPVAEDVRGILDGHIVLSADLAARSHYPAIDITRSRSRVMTRVADAEHRAQAARLVELTAKLSEIELLVQIGEYQAGSDALADAALAAADGIREFLCQDMGEITPFEAVRSALAEVVA